MQKVIHYPENSNFKGSITVEGLFFYKKDVHPVAEGQLVARLKSLNSHNPGLHIKFFTADDVLLSNSSNSIKEPNAGNRAYEIQGDMEGKIFPEIRYNYSLASFEEIKENMWSVLVANPGSIVKTNFEGKTLVIYLG